MDEIIHLPTIGTWDRSLAEIKDCIAQVERIAEQTRRVAEEYGRTDADREAWCLTIFHQCLRADVKNWFEDLDAEIQEDWEWVKEEFFYWFGETSQQRSYRTEFQNRVRTMQQGTRKVGEYLRICKAMATLTTDKYLVFLAAQAFVNGLNSNKIRQELEDILPKGRYDFQDIESAFRKLLSRYEAKKSLVVPLQVLGEPAMISVGAVLEVSPIAAYQPMSNSMETTLEVSKPQEQHSDQASQCPVQQQLSIAIQQQPNSTPNPESNKQCVSFPENVRIPIQIIQRPMSELGEVPSLPAQPGRLRNDEKVAPYPPQASQNARQQAQPPVILLEAESQLQVLNDTTGPQMEVDSQEIIQLSQKTGQTQLGEPQEPQRQNARVQQTAGNKGERKIITAQWKTNELLPSIQGIVGGDKVCPNSILVACSPEVGVAYGLLLSRSWMENSKAIEDFKEFTIAGIDRPRIDISPTSKEAVEEYSRVEGLRYTQEDREEQESRKGIG
jgi:hypothetical protein